MINFFILFFMSFTAASSAYVAYEAYLIKKSRKRIDRAMEELFLFDSYKEKERALYGD